jgi:hypothetical protein
MPDEKTKLKDIDQPINDAAAKANRAVSESAKIAQPSFNNARVIAGLMVAGLFGSRASRKPLETRPTLEENKELKDENKQPNNNGKA